MADKISTKHYNIYMDDNNSDVILIQPKHTNTQSFVCNIENFFDIKCIGGSTPDEHVNAIDEFIDKFAKKNIKEIKLKLKK